MCFSATASFVAGSTLLAVGAITIKRVKRRADIPFAMVPLLFGIQQLTEGLIWFSFRFNTLWLNVPATFVYSLFAYIFWPVYIPFVVKSLETVPWRRKLLSLFQLVGIAVGAYLLYFHLQAPVTSQVVNKSIAYTAPHFETFWIIVFYFSATGISALFSSHTLVNIFGVLIFISAIVTYQFYSASFVSVWCYFAAILSIVIYWYIRNNSTAEGQMEPKLKV